MRTSYLAVEKIQTKGLQTRVSIDPVTVREYREAVTQQGIGLPPIVVFRDEMRSLWIGDGIHRLEAAKQIGQKQIKCDVREGCRADALRYALGANGTHGLRRTNADKANAVKMAYEYRAELGLPEVPTARLIADLVGVHHTFVATQLATVASWASATARTGADGKTRELPPVPVRNKASAGPGTILPPVPVRPVSMVTTTEGGAGEDRNMLQFPPPVRQTTPEGAEPPADEAIGLVDSVGRHVPEDLAPLWHRRQEVQDFLTLLSRMRSTIRHAQDGQDPLWAEINFSSLLAHLDRAYTEVDSTKPYVVCPMCQGIGCRACKERGLLGKYRYDTVIPRELKGKVS
jgi:hypothetical protein